MNKHNIDYKIFFTVLALIIFGMIMISSVSVYSSFDLTEKWVNQGRIKEAYNSYYVTRNITSVIAGFLAFVFVVKIDYRFFEKYVKWIFVASALSLVGVLIFGIEIKGAKGWLDLPGLPSIQPAEFAKVSLILFLGFFLKKYKTHLGSFQKGVIPFVAILGVMVVLIGLQPDFGTLLIMIPVATIMFFYAGAKIKHILLLILIGITGIIGLYFIGSINDNLNYITRRVDNFLFDKVDETTDAGYQNDQAIIAIGSGGITGRGFGQSVQKFGYLPEAEGDFIFSIIVEELGFLGGFLIIFLYLFIGYRAFYVANYVKDPFGKYVALGVGSRIVFQAFLNIGVNLSLLPNTGITLPFVSFGGSSVLSLMIALGILLSISRHVETIPEYSRLKNKKFLF